MKDYSVSEENLNAYVDQQLDTNDRADILAQIRQQPELSQQVNELQELKEWVRMSYQEPPGISEPPSFKSFHPFNHLQAIAASILLLFGGLLGWMIHGPDIPDNITSFHELEQAESVTQTSSKVLIHISKMDLDRVSLALDKAEQLLKDSQQRDKPLQLEVIANAQGLALLRDGSPFGHRIESLSKQHDNIAFLACGIAMQNVRLTEGIEEVQLLPQAQQVDAALEQILRRLKAGWAYVRG